MKQAPWRRHFSEGRSEDPNQKEPTSWPLVGQIFCTTTLKPKIHILIRKEYYIEFRG